MWGPSPRIGGGRPYLPPMRPPMRMRSAPPGMRPPPPRPMPGQRPRFPPHPLLRQGPIRPPPPMFGPRQGLRPTGLRPPPPRPSLRSPPLGVRSAPPGFMPGYHQGFRPQLGQQVPVVPPTMRPMAGRGRGGGAKGNPKEKFLRQLKQCGDEHFCETCDRSFRSDVQLSEHIAQHRTCGLEGCQFTAHPGVVAKHIQMQHDSGLFKKIKNLYTPEDIAKWREERKRSYPSKDNVERRQAVQEEKIKRGETLVTENQRFGYKNTSERGRPHGERGRGRGGRGHRARGRGCSSRPHPELAPPHQATSNKNEDISTWCRNLPPFCGTGMYDKVVATVQEVEVPREEFSDTEWTESSAKVRPRVPTMSNALTSLVELYGSDSDESETEETTCLPKQPPAHSASETKSNTEDLEQNGDVLENKSAEPVVVNEESLTLSGFPERAEDPSVPMETSLSAQESRETSLLVLSDDMPTEAPVLRNDVSPWKNITSNNVEVLSDGPAVNSNNSQQDNASISTGIQTEGNQNKRKRSHRNHSNKNDNSRTEQIKNYQKNVPSRSKPYPFKRRRPTLLQELLRNEIRHERNVLLQCVRYTIENSFFQKPGAHST